MKKIISIGLLIYFILLVPLFTYLRFSRAFKSDDLWLQITKEDGVSYTEAEELAQGNPARYFEYALYKDSPNQVLYLNQTLDTTIRVWKQYICDNRGEETEIVYCPQVPPFNVPPIGFFVHPAVSTSMVNVILDEKEITLNGSTEVGELPYMGDTRIDFYARAYSAGVLSYGDSLIFLPDDLMLTYYNEHTTTNIQSLEELSYDAILIRITYDHIPTRWELNQFTASLEEQGYTVHRPIQQSEITWRNTRIYYFTTVTVMVSGIMAFLLIREKRRRGA